MVENTEEETENEDMGSKNRKNASQKDPEFIARHNENQRRWAHKLKQEVAEAAQKAIDEGKDVWLTSQKRTDYNQCIRASEIKDWGLSNTPEVRELKKGDAGYYESKIL